MKRELTVAEQLRTLADRLDDEGEGALDFGDEMLRQTIQDEVKRVLVDLDSKPDWVKEEDADEWHRQGAAHITGAICILLNDISENRTEPTKPERAPPDYNDPRISWKGEGKP